MPLFLLLHGWVLSGQHSYFIVILSHLCSSVSPVRNPGCSHMAYSFVFFEHRVWNLAHSDQLINSVYVLIDFVFYSLREVLVTHVNERSRQNT